MNTHPSCTKKMSKVRCQSCKSTNGLKIKCKFCQYILCTYCLIPEQHGCENIAECKQMSKDKLNDELMKNKCVKMKLESI